ncbi:helix-turn-helix domain-containing protein [Paraflavitalea speifideaquila]|uniref:helix-turn-helix domain-containing protein n=1 Tax=Paraflavitalea speifideaquila TaxID=3076558 RepID=UPI0028ED12E0|nr:helix-turn-helix domain-containing protein [Paraflavitalea speifideiaquila]
MAIFATGIKAFNYEAAISRPAITGEEKMDLSQQELARLARVHFTNVGKYERGKQRLRRIS